MQSKSCRVGKTQRHAATTAKDAALNAAALRSNYKDKMPGRKNSATRRYNCETIEG
jgi:hypothetical protein